MWKHKNFINLQLCAGPIPYEVIVNGTTFSIQRLSDSGLTDENTWSYNASINTGTYSISGNTVVWNDGTILQYNGVDVLPTDDIIGIEGNPGIYTTRSATPTLTFKHFFDAGTIGSGTVKFRHYSQTEPLPQLATPQNVTADGTTVSWDAVENATSYEILVGGSSFGTVSTTSVDLSTLAGWTSLTDGDYSVTVVAKADGYADSEPSAAVSVTKQGGGGGGIVEMPNISNWTATKVSGDFAGTLTLYTTNNDGNKIQCGPKGYEWITKINGEDIEIPFSDVASVFGITQDSDGNNIIPSEWGFNSAFDNRVTNDGLDGGSCIMQIDTNGYFSGLTSTDIRVLVYDANTDTMRVDTCEVNEMLGELTTKYAYGFNQIFGTIMRI
jgi:hypothetical protein